MQNQQNNQTTIQCSNCGQPFNTTIYSYIDVTQAPQAKALLLSNHLNRAQCPNCGAENVVATPLLYHDPGKELLISYIPMELNLTKDDAEKVIGDLLNRLPKDDFKGYMFNPKRALTMQGLIDQVLEADGITPEMMQEQRERVQLVQEFLDNGDDINKLKSLITEHESAINDQFFQTLTLMAQRALEEGQRNLAQAIIQTQNVIAEHSEYGQELLRRQARQEEVLEAVAQDLEKLGEGAQRDDFLKLALQYAQDDDKLQALVGMARPIFDYEFFQEMSLKIGQAPAAERDTMGQVRDRLLELTTLIDQQQQSAMQNAAGFLQALINHPQPEALLRANMQMLDDTFMGVLSMNIQNAEQQRNVQASAKLKEIYQMVISLLQENMQPELRFLNELLSADDDSAAQKLIEEQISEFGGELIEMVDAVEQVLVSQGDQEHLKRLQALRPMIEQSLSTSS